MQHNNVTTNGNEESDDEDEEEIEQLSFLDIRIMYDLCRFGKAKFPEKESSVWCMAFSTEDLKVINLQKPEHEHSHPSSHGCGC